MVPSDLTIIEDYVRSLHLATLAACALLVCSADFMASKSTFRSLRNDDMLRLYRYHALLIKGLVIFWITGVFLIWRGTAFELAQFSPKLIAKIVVVTILTANALAIGRLALPYFERNKGMTFGQFSLSARMRLAYCAALSSASWISAFCLGAIPWLKTASAVELINFLGPIYAACFAGATLVVAVSALRRSQFTRSDPAPLVLGTSRRLSHTSAFAAE